MRHTTTKNARTADAIAAARMDALVGLKTCTTCRKEKALSAFPAASKGLGGVGCWCKVCTSEYDKKQRVEKRHIRHSTLSRVNKAVLKRQTHGTDVCLLVDAPAYRAAAHLLDEHGLLSIENGHTFKTIFSANKPEKLQKIVEIATLLAAKREIRRAETKARQDARLAARIAEKLTNACGQPRTLELTDANLDELVYQRLRSHLKKCRRVRRSTEFAFTKANFTALTGYTVRELRQHLAKRMPDGQTWADVVSGALHIEHVTPSAAFDLSTPSGVRNCYALSNLTLLCAIENSKKGHCEDKATVAHFRQNPELASLFGLAE